SEECWLWTGYASVGGYGRARWNNKPCYAHRVAWMVTHGAIPHGLQVLHNCPTGDNPRCVNPAHLWLGNAADNIRDAAQKGRVQHGASHWANRHPELVRRGERHHQAKLTEEAVREIRALWNVTATGKELAREFGVGQM